MICLDNFEIIKKNDEGSTKIMKKKRIAKG